MSDFSRFLRVLFKMEGKTSEKGADLAAKIMAWGVCGFLLLLGLSFFVLAYQSPEFFTGSK